MPSISRDAQLQTVITTFEMTPGTCHDLLDLLRDAYAELHQPPAGLHRRGAARQRRADPDRQLLAVAAARGLPRDAALRRDAPAQPRDQRALQELRAGDVRGGRDLRLSAASAPPACTAAPTSPCRRRRPAGCRSSPRPRRPPSRRPKGRARSCRCPGRRRRARAPRRREALVLLVIIVVPRRFRATLDPCACPFKDARRSAHRKSWNTNQAPRQMNPKPIAWFQRIGSPR